MRVYTHVMYRVVLMKTMKNDVRMTGREVAVVGAVVARGRR